MIARRSELTRRRIYRAWPHQVTLHSDQIIGRKPRPRPWILLWASLLHCRGNL